MFSGPFYSLFPYLIYLLITPLSLYRLNYFSVSIKKQISMRKGRVVTKNESIFHVVLDELIRLETKRKGILTVIENMTLST